MTESNQILPYRMSEGEIKAHAEARANSQFTNPGEAEFQACEDEVRQFLADGATYSDERGWEWPDGKVGPL